jgi:uncharacterized lipoprotein YmbA
MKTFLSFVVLTVLLGLAGCNVLPEQQADTVRYFTLSAAAAAPVAAVDATTVRPVQLAGHLRNRAMAVRVAENEVIYLDDVRWAESLGDAITQLLRVRLGSAGGNNVVSVQIQRCELARFEGNSVQLTATYSILSPGEGAGSKRGVFTASPRTWDGKNYGTLVTQLRDAVGDLGDAIAAALPEKK